MSFEKWQKRRVILGLLGHKVPFRFLSSGANMNVVAQFGSEKWAKMEQKTLNVIQKI